MLTKRKIYQMYARIKKTRDEIQAERIKMHKNRETDFSIFLGDLEHDLSNVNRRLNQLSKDVYGMAAADLEGFK